MATAQGQRFSAWLLWGTVVRLRRHWAATQRRMFNALRSSTCHSLQQTQPFAVGLHRIALQKAGHETTGQTGSTKRAKQNQSLPVGIRKHASSVGGSHYGRTSYHRGPLATTAWGPGPNCTSLGRKHCICGGEVLVLKFLSDFRPSRMLGNLTFKAEPVRGMVPCQPKGGLRQRDWEPVTAQIKVRKRSRRRRKMKRQKKERQAQIQIRQFLRRFLPRP